MQLLFYFMWVFLHQRSLMVFHWILSESKSLQVPRTLLSILAVLNKTVLSMVFGHPQIYNFTRPLSKPSDTVTCTRIIIGIIVTLMFHSCFSSLARSKYLSFLMPSLIFTMWSARTAKFPVKQVLYSIIIIRSGFLAGTCFIPKSQRMLYVSILKIVYGVCRYHWVLCFNFLENSQWTLFRASLCQVLYSFCACLPDSF